MAIILKWPLMEIDTLIGLFLRQKHTWGDFFLTFITFMPFSSSESITKLKGDKFNDFSHQLFIQFISWVTDT